MNTCKYKKQKGKVHTNRVPLKTDYVATTNLS